MWASSWLRECGLDRVSCEKPHSAWCFRSRAFPSSWDGQRILPGPPLSDETVITSLLAHNVTVGIGIEEGWQARNTRFDVLWVSNGAARP